MEREILNLFLRSGPARKYDVIAYTRRLQAEDANAPLLFNSAFFNNAILFKYVNVEGNHYDLEDRPIRTLVYFPYDARRPGDGGEGFLFCEEAFWRFFQAKKRRDLIDCRDLQADLDILTLFNSVPTFSPLILDLAFDRIGLTIPRGYLDLTPELRMRLKGHIRNRIRPLIVSAYAQVTVDVERAVEEMVEKLLCLRQVRDILPLIEALRIPIDQAHDVISSWIGITYFEYEYSVMQNRLKDFAAWMKRFSMPQENLGAKEKEYLTDMVGTIQKKIKEDWGFILNISRQYRESYQDFIFRGKVDAFSKFLKNSRTAFWQMGDLLGRLEQTVIAWQQFTRAYPSQRLPFARLIDFYGILRQLHIAPPAIPQLQVSASPAAGGSFLLAEIF